MKFQILLFTIAFILAISEANSQTIAVKSFRKLETDQEARIVSPKTDQNGKKCAIIKVVTSQSGFVFDFGMIGNAVATEQKTAEIWVWVPVGARKVTIKHQQLGVLRDYLFTIDIEEATVYEMVLISGSITTTVNEVITSQWLVIKSEPAKAMIYLDDQFMKTGEYQAKLKPGSYTYRVEAPLYHTEAGKIEIKDTKKEIVVNLKAAFGYISVTSTPESSATVTIDGKEQAQVTPCISEPLASGEHTVQVVKEMYQPSAQKINVSDGQTTPVNFTLNPNFAEVSITATTDATIFINNQQKGIGTWQGRLNSGVYSLEARKEKYRTASLDIEVSAGDKRTVDLQPIPIYGSLDIITTPSGATITIEGREYGTTPNTIDKLLIGNYTVQLNKTDYATVNKTVSITEGKSSEVNETLVDGRTVSINSTPNGADLTIDGNLVGQTPFNGNLTFGNHKVCVIQGDKKLEKVITINQTGGETNFTLSFSSPNYIEEVYGINIEMVAVSGGTFQMGNNEGKTEEKPMHSVTVGEFNIGKYEVTQEQWKAIMGNNPSKFKGDKLPVEQVSWNDVQEFIKKLNTLTSNTYRLPSEAEWEYAARGGNISIGYIYSGSNNLNDVAWYSDNCRNKPQKVGSKKSNELGLFDMTGNVWEWCNDWYGNYIDRPQSNPSGPSVGFDRVRRGSSCGNIAQHCQLSGRGNSVPTLRDYHIGFRLVR